MLNNSFYADTKIFLSFKLKTIIRTKSNLKNCEYAFKMDRIHGGTQYCLILFDQYNRLKIYVDRSIGNR